MADKEDLHKDFNTPLNLLFADTSRDQYVGQNELGQRVYKAPSGKTYTVGEVEASPSLPEIAKKVKENIPPVEEWRLPTEEELKGAAQSVAQGIVDVVKAPTNPDATLGDVFAVAGTMATPGIGSFLDKADPSLVNMFGGIRGRKSDTDSYQEARQKLKNGENPEQVWKDTGWARNKNGQLRFEIDDDDFNYLGTPDNQFYYLSDVAQHKQLFDNYPELKNTRVSEQQLADDHFGYADFDINGEPFIVINSKMSPEEKSATMLHELQHIVQSIEDPNFAQKYEQNRTLYGYRDQPEEIEAELPIERLKSDKEFRRAVKPQFAEGGMVLEPTQQNPVPPGATPKEVADDIDIKVSEGEYVIPANVVRFLGLDKIEKMISKAKEQLGALEEQGRMGGENPDDLPFSPEELQVIEDEQSQPSPSPAGFATGGLVTANQSDNEIDPVTGLPKWMLQRGYNSGFTSQGQRESSSGDNADTNPPKGLAGSISQWTPKEFEQYSLARNDPGQQFGQYMASMIPFGGIAAKIRQRDLERNVPKELARILETKTDLQGNPLDPEQLARLQSSYDRMTSEPLKGFGREGLARNLAEETGLIKKREPDTRSSARQKKAVEEDSIVNRVIDAVSRSDRSKEDRERMKREDQARRESEKNNGGGSNNSSSAPKSSPRPQSRNSK